MDWHNGWSGEKPDAVVERANTLAERAMQSDPEEPLTNIAIAVAARYQRDPARAEQYGRRALALSPDSGLALFSLAATLCTSGRPEDAVPLLERAIRLDPGWSQQYLQFLGQSHFLLGNFETAALVFRERLQLARDTDVGRAWLASALGHLGEIDDAQKVWNRLRELNPGFCFSRRLARFNYVRAADTELVLAGLAKACLVDADPREAP